MQSLDNSTKAFLALVRGGLWETEVRLSHLDNIDFSQVLKLAEEQCVVGLVAAGLEHVADVKVPKEYALQFVGQALQLEQRNLAMNKFVGDLVDKMRDSGIYTLLVKGQGVAQCYERPLWRTAGDIDFLLSNDNYNSAKKLLIPFAEEIAREDNYTKHQALHIKGFDVELHGRMPFILSKRVDNGIDKVLEDLFYGGNVRSWMNNSTIVFLPSPGNDVILVFTHLLHHFFIEGVGLRQICDWCRLLWKYQKDIDKDLLSMRLKSMGVSRVWKIFAALAVNKLGMPEDAMPFYDSKFCDKSESVLNRVLKCGNFGHNNDLSYRAKYTGLTYKIVAVWRRFVDFTSLVQVFPKEAPRFFMGYLVNKV